MTHAAKVRIDIGSLGDLERALVHPDAQVRRGVLDAIQARPAQAAGLDAEDGRDLTDVLLGVIQVSPAVTERMAATVTLLTLPGPRAAAAALEVFRGSEDPRLVLLAAGRIAELPADVRTDELSPLVQQQGPPTRLRAAANLLADLPNLPIETALRVALLSDHDTDVPPVTPESLPAWLDALQGDRPDTAWRELRRGGKTALHALLGAWDELTSALRARVLTWAAEMPTPEGWQHVRALLASQRGTDTTVPALAAFGAMRDLARVVAEGPPGLGEALVRPYLTHPKPDVRAAAYRAWRGPLPRPPSLRERMTNEPSAEVRKALTWLLLEEGSDEAVAALAAALRDADWRVRARATDALAMLGPAGRAALEAAMQDGRTETRVAAARGLHRIAVDTRS